MTLYNALPRKEYERVFMCKTANEVWHILIITHQSNSQVKDCKIDLLTQQYEKFSISDEETIDSGFTRFNAIVTSLKSLYQYYSSKNHMKKFLRALPLKWRAKQGNSESSSERVIDSDAKIDLATGLIDLKEATEIVLETKEVKAQDKSVVATINVKKVTSLLEPISHFTSNTQSQDLYYRIYTLSNYTNTQDNQDRDLVFRRKKEKSLDYNNSFLGEYECSSLVLDREERKDEKKRLDILKQDQTMLVIKRFNERKKVFRERKKTGKIRAKRSLFKLEIVHYLKARILNGQLVAVEEGEVGRSWFGGLRVGGMRREGGDGMRFLTLGGTDGFLEKFRGGLERDIDDEGEEDKENEESDGEV
ncbi:hypothetical protein Tco_0161984 [Tanacetum coccineum]